MNIPGTGWLYTFNCLCHTVFGWRKSLPDLVKDINIAVDVTETEFESKFPISWASNLLWHS